MIASMVSPTKTKRRYRLTAKLLVVFFDLILAGLALYFSWWLRYEMEIGPDLTEFQHLEFRYYQPVLIAHIALVFVAFQIARVYRLRRSTGLVEEIGRIFLGSTLAAFFLTAVFFLWRLEGYAGYSRAMFIFLWLNTPLIISASRLLTRVGVDALRRRGRLLEQLVVVGGGMHGKMIMQQVVTHQNMGYRLVGFLDDDHFARGAHFGRIKVLGPVDHLAHAVQAHGVERVIIALPATEHRSIAEIIEQCKQQRVGFYVVPDLFEIQLNTVDLDSIGGIPIIGLKDGGIVGWNFILKRLLDSAVSAAVLLLGSPVFFLIALAIKLESSGPVFYGAERVGQDGKPFRMFKFRSMREDAEQLRASLADRNQADGPLFKIENDPRRTRVGAWLRRLSLDELPQFWNILRGDMSLVGPRAPLSEEVDQYEEWQMKRLIVKPGLTGLWQVNGRSNVPFEEMVMMDIYYIDNWSLGLDINLIIRTIPAVIGRDGAY